MTTRTVTIDGISLNVGFTYYNAEPENGAPDEYNIHYVSLHKDSFDKDMSVLFESREEFFERIIKELEKAKGEM